MRSRDYFSMAHILGSHPGVHLTINFSPSLLMQVADYVEGRATDEAWELSRVPAERLDEGQKERLLTTFFDADWHNQIFIHPRYRELFERRRDGLAFSAQDLRDLQVWFSLAWFGQEMREGSVALPDGNAGSVAELVRRGERFTAEDVEVVLATQLQVMRSIVPLHRRLAAAGQLELAITPFFHPILPLVMDTDLATIDRPGTTLPTRFARPEDAEAQVARAVGAFERWFGAPPRARGRRKGRSRNSSCRSVRGTEFAGSRPTRGCSNAPAGVGLPVFTLRRSPSPLSCRHRAARDLDSLS